MFARPEVFEGAGVALATGAREAGAGEVGAGEVGAGAKYLLTATAINTPSKPPDAFSRRSSRPCLSGVRC